MADPISSAPINLDLAAQQQLLARRQAMAQMLLQEGMTPQQGQMVSGHYVAPSPLSFLSRALQVGTGMGIQNASDAQSVALGQEGARRIRLANEMAQLPELQHITPDMLNPIQPPQSGKSGLAKMLYYATTPTDEILSQSYKPQAASTGISNGAGATVGALPVQSSGNFTPSAVIPQNSSDNSAVIPQGQQGSGITITPAARQFARQVTTYQNTGQTDLMKESAAALYKELGTTDDAKKMMWISQNTGVPLSYLANLARKEMATKGVITMRGAAVDPDTGKLVAVVPENGKAFVQDSSSPAGVAASEIPGYFDLEKKGLDIKNRSEAQFHPEVTYTSQDGPLYPGGPIVPKGTAVFTNRAVASGNPPSNPALPPQRLPLPPIHAIPGQQLPLQGAPQNAPPINQSAAPRDLSAPGTPINPTIGASDSPIGPTGGSPFPRPQAPTPISTNVAKAPPVNAPMLAGAPVGSVETAVQRERQPIANMQERYVKQYQEPAANAQNIIDGMNEVKRFSYLTPTGIGADKLNIGNAILGAFGQEKAQDANTAYAMIKKLTANMVANGKADTDAARTLQEAANPNTSMSGPAIREATNYIIAQQVATQAKANLLLQHYSNGNQKAFDSSEQQLNKVLSPVAIKDVLYMTDLQQSGATVPQIKAAFSKLPADRQQRAFAARELLKSSGFMPGAQ